jgi:hypothetical protein
MQECPVCLDEIVSEFVVCRPCQHELCGKCWLTVDKETCVLCREVLYFTVKIKLFDGRLQRFNVGHKMTCLDVRRLLTDTLGVTSRESQLIFEWKSYWR